MSSVDIDHKAIHRIWVRQHAARLAKLIGFLGLIGWFSSVECLTNWASGSVAMMPATSLMSLIAGIGVENDSERSAMGVGLFLVISFVLFGYFDFVKLIGSDYQAVKPGMPSWGTLAVFSMIRCDLLLRNRTWFGWLPVIAFLAASFALFGHAINQPWMYYYSDSSTAMAIPTASALAACAVGAMCRDSADKLRCDFRFQNPGGVR